TASSPRSGPPLALGRASRAGSVLSHASHPVRVDLDPRAHGRGERDGPEIAAFGRGRFGPDDLVDHRQVVVEQRLLVEGRLVHDEVEVSLLVHAIIELVGLDIEYSFTEVHYNDSI